MNGLRDTNPGYIRVSNPAFKRKIVGAEADFERYALPYRRIRLPAGEVRWLNAIEAAFAETEIGLGR